MHTYLLKKLQHEHEDDDAAKLVDKRNKDVIFKNCAPFRQWINNKKHTYR